MNETMNEECSYHKVRVRRSLSPHSRYPCIIIINHCHKHLIIKWKINHQNRSNLLLHPVESGLCINPTALLLTCLNQIFE